YNPHCTADGSTLIFESCPGDRCELIRKSLESGESAVLAEIAGGVSELPNSLISPDGTKVLMQIPVNHNDPYEWAETIPVAGGVAQRLKMPFTMREKGAWAWSPDGKAVLCVRNENGVGNVWSIPIEAGRPKKVTAFDSDLITTLDVAPD